MGSCQLDPHWPYGTLALRQRTPTQHMQRLLLCTPGLSFVSINYNGALETRHFKLEAHIARSGHETGISQPPKQSMIRALDLDYPNVNDSLL